MLNSSPSCETKQKCKFKNVLLEKENTPFSNTIEQTFINPKTRTQLHIAKV